MTPTTTIIGAGLGGLMLARLLHLRGLPVSVYEADDGPTSRTQGGMLDIHVEDGQAALREAGLFEAFKALVHPGGQATRVLDPDGNVLVEKADADGSDRPEVKRGDLRQLLIDSLPPRTIHWGHKLTTVFPVGHGAHQAHFDNGRVITTRLLVGADGAWSRVRPLVSSANPTYVGMTFVETFLFDCDIRHHASAQVAGTGALMVPARGKAIFTHREPANVLHTYAMLEKPLGWSHSLAKAAPPAALAKVAGEFENWAPPLVDLIRNSDTSPIFRTIHSLSVGHAWTHHPGVTLLGDAAHLMPPAGEGANLALFDAAQLAKALTSRTGVAGSALQAYEKQLFARGKAAASAAHALMARLCGEDASRGLLDVIDPHQP
ncbi:MAG TPA: NAD(P)/FAD-dependent oxidoreductase [Rhodanobacteraceae bacterium]